ncbi:uncharacterized protein [Clytia hemisphaerica]|uniref:uncharacterized protein n=1 Tax=Clytia hemisphaerica TaxID=252671 RepID=UPI0034D4AA29
MINGFDQERYFISLQTYADTIIAAHAFILSLLVTNQFYPNDLIQRNTFGSNRCEKLFGRLRGFVRGKSNFNYLEMLDFSGRLQKLELLKSYPEIATAAQNFTIPDLDNLISTAIKEAETEVVSSMRELGIVDCLIKGFVLEYIDEKLVLKNVSFFGMSTEDFDESMPDESKIYDVDDFEDMPPGELADLVTENDQVENLTSAVSKAVYEDCESSDEASDDEQDENDPTQCALFSLKKCKFTKSSRVKNSYASSAIQHPVKSGIIVHVSIYNSKARLRPKDLFSTAQNTVPQCTELKSHQMHPQRLQTKQPLLWIN